VAVVEEGEGDALQQCDALRQCDGLRAVRCAVYLALQLCLAQWPCAAAVSRSGVCIRLPILAVRSSPSQLLCLLEQRLKGSPDVEPLSPGCIPACHRACALLGVSSHDGERVPMRGRLGALGAVFGGHDALRVGGTKEPQPSLSATSSTSPAVIARGARRAAAWRAPATAGRCGRDDAQASQQRGPERETGAAVPAPPPPPFPPSRGHLEGAEKSRKK
jgi:hypothetical protein